MAHRHGARRARRRRPGRLAHARRRAGARLRLLRVLRPQGLRADGHRRGVRQGASVLETMPPWQGGGNMIADVTFEKTTYQPAPQRFEAGTGNIADAVGLGAALDYVSASASRTSSRYEHELLVYARGAARDAFRAHADRHRRREGRRPLVRARRRPHRRRRRGARSRGHRGARGPPLRAAHPSPLWAREHGARVARAVQHVRGHRRPGGCPAPARWGKTASVIVAHAFVRDVTVDR